MGWIEWAHRLAHAAARAERLAPVATCPCHWGGVDAHTVRGVRAIRLRTECRRQLRAWYEASRWRGAGTAPEDHTTLARALEGRAAIRQAVTES